ncbi:MAG TPA: glycosyltransferase family 2 protein [Planctomycetes bacterium]|nr:glycosyltransferase family 2 protein [Planctomycetota bacterium]
MSTTQSSEAPSPAAAEEEATPEPAEASESSPAEETPAETAGEQAAKGPRTYREHRIGIVVPCHNEETQIGRVIETMPDFVDKIIIINDTSTDGTHDVVVGYQEHDDRVVLIDHEINQGVGGAIASGYKWARDNDIDIAVVMAGDGQMDPAELPRLLDPVVEGRVDYSKANRLLSGQAYRKIPKVRYFGNSVLSLLTKIASGYWHIADSQTGYTAINKRALKQIDWDRMYKRYGQPNDLLVRLNVYNFRVCDIPMEPVYNVGERSGIKIRRVLFTISWLLLSRFFWRLKEKYIIRDFHPLVFFYLLSFVMFAVSSVFTVRFGMLWYQQKQVPEITFMVLMFSVTMGLMSAFFAMMFDMESNRDLRG